LIRKKQVESWCLIHSFNDEVLYDFHHLAPEIILRKLLIWKIPHFPLYFDTFIRFCSLKKYHFVTGISINFFFISKSLISEIHSLGKKANAWTVNNPKSVTKLIQWGIDGIITDYPVVPETLTGF
jgi:glycerophosphoryl diester phosphodiesterase